MKRRMSFGWNSPEKGKLLNWPSSASTFHIYRAFFRRPEQVSQDASDISATHTGIMPRSVLFTSRERRWLNLLLTEACEEWNCGAPRRRDDESPLIYLLPARRSMQKDNFCLENRHIKPSTCERSENNFQMGATIEGWMEPFGNEFGLIKEMEMSAERKWANMKSRHCGAYRSSLFTKKSRDKCARCNSFNFVLVLWDRWGFVSLMSSITETEKRLYSFLLISSNLRVFTSWRKCTRLLLFKQLTFGCKKFQSNDL